MKSGLCVIITGPSGVGKTTAIKNLLVEIPDAVRLVTTTTRPPRIDELDGRDYHFVSREKFLKSVERGEFLEYNEHYGNLYGSSLAELNRLLASNHLVFMLLDINGAINAKKILPQTVSIFLLPGHINELKHRLTERNAHTEDELQSRLVAIQKEIDQAQQLDYQVTNIDGHIEQATAAVTKIIQQHTEPETT